MPKDSPEDGVSREDANGLACFDIGRKVRESPALVSELHKPWTIPAQAWLAKRSVPPVWQEPRLSASAGLPNRPCYERG